MGCLAPSGSAKGLAYAISQMKKQDKVQRVPKHENQVKVVGSSPLVNSLLRRAGGH